MTTTFYTDLAFLRHNLAEMASAKTKDHLVVHKDGKHLYDKRRGYGLTWSAVVYVGGLKQDLDGAFKQTREVFFKQLEYISEIAKKFHEELGNLCAGGKEDLNKEYEFNAWGQQITAWTNYTYFFSKCQEYKLLDEPDVKGKEKLALTEQAQAVVDVRRIVPLIMPFSLLFRFSPKEKLEKYQYIQLTQWIKEYRARDIDNRTSLLFIQAIVLSNPVADQKEAHMSFLQSELIPKDRWSLPCVAYVEKSKELEKGSTLTVNDRSIKLGKELESSPYYKVFAIEESKDSFWVVQNALHMKAIQQACDDYHKSKECVIRFVDIREIDPKTGHACVESVSQLGGPIDEKQIKVYGDVLYELSKKINKDGSCFSSSKYVVRDAAGRLKLSLRRHFPSKDGIPDVTHMLAIEDLVARIVGYNENIIIQLREQAFLHLANINKFYEDVIEQKLNGTQITKEVFALCARPRDVCRSMIPEYATLMKRVMECFERCKAALKETPKSPALMAKCFVVYFRKMSMRPFLMDTMQKQLDAAIIKLIQEEEEEEPTLWQRVKNKASNLLGLS